MTKPRRSIFWGGACSWAMWRRSKTSGWWVICGSTAWWASWTGRPMRCTASRRSWGCTTSSTPSGYPWSSTTSTTSSDTWISRAHTSRICSRSITSSCTARSTCPAICRWSWRQSWRSSASTTITRTSSPRGGDTSMNPITRLMRGWRGLKSISGRRIRIIGNCRLSDLLHQSLWSYHE